jgi:uncharacterized protein YndB with AHSA1/START domain
MRAYQATAVIDAAPEQVWRVLTDTAAWPDWDSGVTKVDGHLALGQKLSITVEANPRRAFPVKVLRLDQPELIVFRGGMPLGLFTGERTYTLKSEDRRTRFTMLEQYTGPLSTENAVSRSASSAIGFARERRDHPCPLRGGLRSRRGVV